MLLRREAQRDTCESPARAPFAKPENPTNAARRAAPMLPRCQDIVPIDRENASQAFETARWFALQT